VLQNPSGSVLFYYILLSKLNVEEAITILDLIQGMKNPCFLANIEQKAKMAKILILELRLDN